MNSFPYSTPRTPKGYKRTAEPPSPLARFNQNLPSELPSLRGWKETCRSFHELNTSTTSSSSTSTTNKGISGDYKCVPYKTFDKLMLLEDVLDANLDGEWSNSFNAHAPKRSKRRAKLEEFGERTKEPSIGTCRG